MEALKPCPTCGGKAEYDGACDLVRVQCSEDNCLMATLWFDEPEDAAQAWNTRPTENALRAKLEMAEARCKSSLDLYEGYHDRNIELRAEIAAVKAEQDWHSVDDADNLVRCLCPLGISTERYSVCGQQWPTSEFQRAVRHVLAGVPGLVERINADIVRKDAEIAALEELIAEIGLAHPIVVAARARLAALGE